MFASTSLAARIEAVESRLMAEIAAAAARRRPRAGVFVLEVAGGSATWVGEGSPANKVAGLGFGGPPAEALIEAVEQAFAARRSPVQVELSCLAEPTLAAEFTRRGYLLVNFENVLGRPLPADLPPSPTGIEVRDCGAADPTWLDAITTGFAHPDLEGVPSHESFPRELVERTLLDMAGVPGLRHQLAWRNGALAGAGSMRVSDGVAQLCGAATLPQHRRRGVQTALTLARLRAAAGAGCDLAVVTTQPGSRSQQNAQHQGFSLLYTRAILVRGAPGAERR
ncbi:MAG TPA: GNAT family N-acetyltransferase [Vicinamibacteria bacterium]|nr:GNAT family N-acetyltransferase [Vicinamibacteria bacterium]